MTNRVCMELGLDKIPINSSIIGIIRSISNITHKCTFTLQSLHNSYEKEIPCLILDSIVDDLPELSINGATLGIPPHLRLADPGFSTSGKIDILIETELFWQLLCIGQHNLGTDKPILQKTKLGWIVAGNMGSKSSQPEIHCNIAHNQNLHEQLEKFWMLESFEEKTPMSREDNQCEDIFNKSVERNESGRFIVRLPLKEAVSDLGDSKHMAMTRFASLEKKFKYNKVLKKDYVQFMTEYEQLGHMSEYNMESEEINYFLPHHGVHNINSTTTSLRVVFDGSAKTDTGLSLNDIMYRGPNIQEDLVSIIFRFRQWRYVICGDTKKMYRQILVAKDQRRLQCILWRKKEDEPIKTFNLNTVTYGTKAAPYLAVRCLKQLAYEYQEQEPEASRTILSDFYVDDLITGGNTIDETITKAKSICKILTSAGFELHKWGSNNSTILNQLETKSQTNHVHFESNDTKITVGLYWGCTQDTLQFSIQEMTNRRVTKRTILSDIAHIYDPLGLLSPSIIVAKIILQNLWASKLTWDETVSADVYTKWRTSRKELPMLNKLQLPRYVIGNNALRLELHGFSDASQSAYGACIYMRTEVATGKFITNLFCAKTRVAPLRPTAIPRLELCSALLLAQLVKKTQKTIQIKFDKTYLWSDSSITLHWINTPANLLQPFVGNRIEQIQTLTKQNEWYHVRTHHNPADLLTRGISPNELLQSKLWWQGPSWLNKSFDEWPDSTIKFSSKPPELRKQPRENIQVDTSHAVSAPVKIHKPQSSRTWRNSSDLECISLGQDLLVLQECNDPDLQIQDLIDSKPWKDNLDSLEVDEKHHSIWNISENIEVLDSKELGLTSQNIPTFISNTIKPIGNVTATTLHNMKELQQSTVNNVVKPVSQATSTAMHKIGDLQDEAAGVMEGIFDFGMAGIRKGLRLTGLQDNIDKPKIDILRLPKPLEVLPVIHQKPHKIGKLTKIPHVMSEDAKVIPQNDTVWMNPLIKDSPNFDGEILLEKSPIAAPKVPTISTEDTTSPDPEYEDATDLATTTAKLRTLLEQRTSDSTMNTPAVSPMPPDDSNKLFSSPLEYRVSSTDDIDGALPSLYKFCARTATGVFQNTLNTLKTALPGNISDQEHRQDTMVNRNWDSENWMYVASDVGAEDFTSRAQRLLNERRAFCTVDNAYEAVESLDVLDQIETGWNIPATTYDDELDDLEVHIPFTKAFGDIFCELVSKSDTFRIQESVVKILLILFGDLTEDYICNTSVKITKSISSFIGKFPNESKKDSLALTSNKFASLCLDIFPSYFETIIGEETLMTASKTFLLSLQNHKINQDVSIQFFELVASLLIEASNKMTPAYSA